MTLHVMDVVGSTNDEARLLAEAGAPAFTAVMARQQTAGRGRGGRMWVSPPGNLHLSVVLRPEVPLRRVPELAIVAALAVADTADTALGRPAVRLKWPNDVLVDGAKLSGILLERDGDAVIAGMGMNVAHTPPDMPYAVTSLAAQGVSMTAPDLAPILLDALRSHVGRWIASGFAATRLAWLARGPAMGTMLAVRSGDASEAGGFAGLDEDGALLLETASGLRRVIAGEVTGGRSD